MSAGGGNHEIPEQVYREQFGGGQLRDDMQVRQRSNLRVLALLGILIFLVGAPILSAVAWGLIKMRHCAWGLLC